MKIYYTVIFFTLYSFAGWLLEIAYRSLTQKRFVNPGFLIGPFLPIYGIGAITVLIIYRYVDTINIALQFLIYFVLLSAIEYITGEIFEKLYGLKLWDYSNCKFNIGGKISLRFSIAWALLAIAAIHIIHPFTAEHVHTIDPFHAKIISSALILYFITDASFSVISLNRFRKNLHDLYTKYVSLSNKEAAKILNSFKRILGAFPSLNELISEKLSINLKHKINSTMGRLSDVAETVKSVVNERIPDEEEYFNIVKDILSHPEFLRLKDFHHHNSSIYNHAKIVSYLAYRISKIFNLDYAAAARGGLLHDFFLYDWRNHSEPDLPRNKFHGTAHPAIALSNATKHFKVNKIEKDIILKHMWPLTMSPPRYYESFIVNFVDKYVASKEFINEYRKKKAKIELLKKL